MISRKWLEIVAVATLLVGGTGVVSAAGKAADGSGGSGTQRFVVSVDAIGDYVYHDSEVFATPVGASGPGPLLPGNA